MERSLVHYLPIVLLSMLVLFALVAPRLGYRRTPTMRNVSFALTALALVMVATYVALRV